MIKTLTLGSNISVSISISMKIYEKRLLIDPDIGQWSKATPIRRKSRAQLFLGSGVSFKIAQQHNQIWEIKEWANSKSVLCLNDDEED